MNKLFVLIVSCLMLSAINGEAQILGKIKSKVKETVGGESSSSNSNQNSSGSNSQNVVNSSKKVLVDQFLPVKDNGMTDAIHAKHLKQVVFSKTSIEYQQGKEEQLTNTFNLGDEIYVMAYFEHSMKNQVIKDKTLLPDDYEPFFNIWYEVNGQVVGKEGDNSWEKRYGDVSYEFEQWTCFCYPLLSLSKCENFNRDNIQLPFQSYVVPLLKQGDNKVKMFFSFEIHEAMQSGRGYSGDLKKELKLLYQPSEPMAVGEITLKVNNIADVKKMLTKSGFIPQAGQSNPTLEKQILTSYNTNNSSDKGVKVIISDTDWTILRNDLGVIIGRSMDVKIVATSKDPDIYIVWDEAAQQSYAGGGQYGTKIVLLPYTTPSYTVSASLFK